jgi:hypothetical protein
MAGVPAVDPVLVGERRANTSTTGTTVTAGAIEPAIEALAFSQDVFVALVWVEQASVIRSPSSH